MEGDRFPHIRVTLKRGISFSLFPSRLVSALSLSLSLRYAEMVSIRRLRKNELLRLLSLPMGRKKCKCIWDDFSHPCH